VNEPGPVLPVFLRTFIRFQDAGNPVVFGFFSLSPADVTVVAIIPDHLLPPVRDVGTHGGQPLQGIEDKVWVSGQSKLGIDAFILAMFPSARETRDQSYLNMVKVFGEKNLDRFIAIVEQEKKKCGLARHGGDPDLFVQSTQNPSDRFFVEVKAEDLTGRRRYQDKLNKQQHLLFPLIEKELKCQVRVAKVQIVSEGADEG